MNNPAEEFFAMDYSVIILAAGTSGRMGLPKISLRFDKAYNFAEKLCNSFNVKDCKKIVLVVNSDSETLIRSEKFKLNQKTEIVLNSHIEFGRFYSLQSGLKNCIQDLPVFFTNIDNPFVDERLIKGLISGLNEADYICPIYKNKGGHPVLISQTVVKDILIQEDNSQNLKTYLQRFKRKNVEFADEKILTNINTPDDYCQWLGCQ
ncbi:MAG TPA: NTP transferase domain-containing protein [Bacteroidales bacterium]|nr:NTP transferase domain-containing protein [Bacteroidales bacterium]